MCLGIITRGFFLYPSPVCFLPILPLLKQTAGPRLVGWSLLEQRGAPMFLYEGYSYTRSREHPNAVYWVCRDRNNCEAKIITDGRTTVVIKRTGEHTHASDPTATNLLKLRTAMKEKAGKSFSQYFMNVSETVFERHFIERRYAEPSMSVL